MEIDNQKITDMERMIDNLIHGAACDIIRGNYYSADEHRQIAINYAFVLKKLGVRDYTKEENMNLVQLAIIVKINRKCDELRKDKDFMKQLMGE